MTRVHSNQVFLDPSPRTYGGDDDHDDDNNENSVMKQMLHDMKIKSNSIASVMCETLTHDLR